MQDGGRLLCAVAFLAILAIANAKFDAPLPTKENVHDYFVHQFLKAGIVSDKADGVLEALNGVLFDHAAPAVAQENTNPVMVVDGDTSPITANDNDFFLSVPRATVFRGKRQTEPLQGAAPVTDAQTGAAIVAHTERTEGLVPYDAHVDPDFPAEAPVARGLKNIPEGFNLEKPLDYDFIRGYRYARPGYNPSYVGHTHRRRGPIAVVMDEPEVGGGEGTVIDGPYIADGGAMMPAYGGGGGGMGYGTPVMMPSYGGGYGYGYGNPLTSVGYGLNAIGQGANNLAWNTLGGAANVVGGAVNSLYYG